MFRFENTSVEVVKKHTHIHSRYLGGGYGDDLNEVETTIGFKSSANQWRRGLQSSNHPYTRQSTRACPLKRISSSIR